MTEDLFDKHKIFMLGFLSALSVVNKGFEERDAVNGFPLFEKAMDNRFTDLINKRLI